MRLAVFFLFLFFSPHHLIYYAGVALDNLHNLSRYVLIYIIRHRQTVFPVKVHLQAVVIMEAQRLMLNYALVQFKAACCQTVAGTRMTGIKKRHIVFFRQLVRFSNDIAHGLAQIAAYGVAPYSAFLFR